MDDDRELSESDVSGSEDEGEINGGEKLFEQSDLASCVMHRKSVFRCRLCPKITCLTEETMKLHLQSKRHTRSEKRMQEGRLKYILNSDGEVEEEVETHAERHARILASTQSKEKTNRKGGRQRQKLRKKRKVSMENVDKEKQSTESQPKKEHKTDSEVNTSKGTEKVGKPKHSTEQLPRKKQKIDSKESTGKGTEKLEKAKQSTEKLPKKKHTDREEAKSSHTTKRKVSQTAKKTASDL